MKTNIIFGGNTRFMKMLFLITPFLFIANTAAATMKIVELPATGTDAAIDISSEKTYTHTFDFGLGDPVTLNGVQFEKGVEGLEIKGIDIHEAKSAQGFGYSLKDSRWYLEKPNYKFWLKNHAGGKDIDKYCDGKSHELLNDFLFHDRSATFMGTGIILKLKDLKPSTEYSVRYYYRSWDPPLPRPQMIYGDAESDSTFKDSIYIDIDTSRVGAQYLDYTFLTDDTDITMKFIFNAEGQGPHLYGLTCEKLKESVGSKQNPKPSNFELGQIAPSPFNSNMNITFRIPENGHVAISVHNFAGRRVATVVDGVKKAGKHSVDFNGSHLRPGVYTVKLTVANKSLARKLFLMK